MHWDARRNHFVRARSVSDGARAPVADAPGSDSPLSLRKLLLRESWRFARRGILWLCLIVALLSPAASRAAEPTAKVYVLFWFDTEDYVLPASDDAALRIADFLTAEGIRGTFKVVGEKARTLERRQRTDVIAALKKHEIGYHSNFHSTQPSPALYLSNLGWDEGVAEFDRREGPGRADVQRIFGVAPTCYGQPGSSWGPQSYGAMKRWGMEVYLDAGLHVQLEDRPHFYCGLLNLYKLAHLTRTNLGGPKDLEKAQERFLEARKALLEEGGGIVSIMYHPCEFVHKEFWDAANFRKGANPPREQWKLPATKTAEETRVAFETFENYVRFLKRFPEVRFITASEAGKLYRDTARGRRFTSTELRAMASAVREEITFQKHQDYTLSASEVFLLLNAYIAERAQGKKVEALQLKETPYGPTAIAPDRTETVKTDWSQLSRASADVASYLHQQGRVPAAIWLGSQAVTPEAYLRTVAQVACDLIDDKPPTDPIEVQPAKLAAATYVSADDPKLWGWPIFPPGFKAPALMELAKRQAWTLKPAILHKE